MLLEGREAKCLFSHFALGLVEEELESACAPLAFPTGTRQAKAFLLALVLKKNQPK